MTTSQVALPLPHARRMGHEAIGTVVPGFSIAIEDAIAQLHPTASGPVPIIHESALDSIEDVDTLLRGYAAELHFGGWSMDAIEQEIDLLAIHAYIALNFALQGRKAFWVGGELAELLQQTRLDITGEVLKLPFPACAFIFDDPLSTQLAAAMIATDPVAQLRQSEIKVLTIYAIGLPPESGDAGVRLLMVSDDLSGRWPHLATRDIPTTDKRNLDDILDSHPDGKVQAFFCSPQMKALVQLALNAILYTTCSDFRFEKHKPPHRRGKLLTRKERRVHEREGLSGETVFYLPGKIKIAGRTEAPQSPVSDHAHWKLTKRFWVRGHWRRPSPSWDDQRVRWIEPYLKGPELTAIIERQYELRT